ncbi:T9SS type A sorting domain-containing protein, partial [bacterium]|nr:T9SS type A sorting domain-containing protein [bacterium]
RQGNRWDYKITDVSQTGAPGPFLVFDIPEENLVDGRIQKVLRAQEREADGTLRDESSCLIDVLGSNQYSAPSLLSCSETGGQCRCMNRMVDTVIQDNKSQYVSVQEQVPIGPWDYWVDGKASYAFVGTGTGGSGGGSSWTRGTDIGLIQYGAWTSCHWAAPNCKDTSWRADLVFAKVDGQIFGATAVDVEERDVPFQMENGVSQPFPNPTMGLVSFEVRVSSPQTVSITIFDLLGREVAAAQKRMVPAGQSMIHIDTNLLMRSGVHFVTIRGQTVDSTFKVILVK